MSDEVLLCSADGVATIQINRPKKKNALTSGMYTAMTQALAEYDRDNSVRVVVLRGEADFTAGNDLLDFMSAGITDFSDAPPLRYLFGLHAFSKPVVSAVSGVAVGIGTTMLLHTDVVLAGESAKFSLPFVKIGLVPEAAATLLLPHAIGYARAKRYLMTGETFDARTAYKIGLVSEVIDDDDLFRVAQEHASALAAMPIGALRETKRLIREPLADQIKATMNTEARAFAECLQSEEFRIAAMRLMQR